MTQLELISTIKDHFESVYPEEGCGLIIDAGDNEFEWVPSKNVSNDPQNSFELEEDVYVYHLLYSKIVSIVHNHVDADSKPSDTDIEACKALRIPYWIFSYPKMKLTVIYPEG